jgi:hypothetical protein
MGEPIQLVYESLLATIFPRLKAGLAWRVQVGQRADYLCGDGYCDPDSQIIWIGEHVADDAKELRLVLAHEIVHAIVGPGHGKKFLRRLDDAAQMAEKKGEHKLARDLRDELKLWENAPAVRAAEVYGLMRDWALEAPSFEVAERGVAGQFSLTTEELRKKYPKLRAAWDDALKRYGR